MQAVILCAGSGIRLRPITDTIPKCMAELKGRPMLERVLEHIINAGIDEVHLIVGYKREIIEDHFGPEFNGTKLNYFVQQEPKGTAHAVSLCKDYIKGQFLIANADVLASKNDYRSIARSDASEEFDGLLLARKVDDPWRFGVLKTDNGAVTDIVEKPNPDEAPSNIATHGAYILPPEIFEALRKAGVGKGEELWLVDGINLLQKEGVPLYAVVIENGKYYDTGNKLEYMKTALDLALKHPEVGEDLKKYLKELMDKP